MIKKSITFVLLIIVLLLSACVGKQNLPVQDDTVIYEKYIGTWYGFGTDGNDAQFQININPKDNTTAYVTMKGWGANINYGNENYEILFSSETEAEEVTNNQRKRKFCFSTVSGNDVFEIYFVDTLTGKEVAQYIPAGKYPDRNKSYGIAPKPQSEPQLEPQPVQPDYTYQKDAFLQIYNQLSSRTVEEGPQQTMNVESGELFNDWDVLLNDVYKYLKTIKSPSEFEAIKNDEIEWIKQKEAAIERSRNEFSGGSMAPLAANMTAIEYTKQRCGYLISLIY